MHALATKCLSLPEIDESHFICFAQHDVVQLYVIVEVPSWVEFLYAIHQLHSDMDDVSLTQIHSFPQRINGCWNVFVNYKELVGHLSGKTDAWIHQFGKTFVFFAANKLC